jgi:hypothetical protein
VDVGDARPEPEDVDERPARGHAEHVVHRRADIEQPVVGSGVDQVDGVRSAGRSPSREEQTGQVDA